MDEMKHSNQIFFISMHVVVNGYASYFLVHANRNKLRVCKEWNACGRETSGQVDPVVRGGGGWLRLPLSYWKSSLPIYSQYIHTYIHTYMEPWASNNSAKALTRCCQLVQPHQERSVYKRSSRSLGFSFSDDGSYAPTPERHARRWILGASARRRIWGTRSPRQIRGIRSRRRIPEVSAR
jgi:hypothetical protein